MTKVLALGVLVAGVTALTAGALLVLGWLRKNRSMKRIGGLVFISSSIGLVGCLAYLSVMAFNKVKNTSPKHVWTSLVNAAFDDTSVRPLDPAAAKQKLGTLLFDSTFLNGAEVQGVWVEGIVLSYGYFVYVADEDKLLSAVDRAPVDPSFYIQSDKVCQESTWAECEEMLMSKNGPQRNLPGWAPEVVADKRCSECLRAPWSHTINDRRQNPKGLPLH